MTLGLVANAAHMPHGQFTQNYSDVSKSETQWAVMVTKTIIKKNNNNYRLYYTVFFGTVHGYSILLAAVKLDDPWRLDFSRVYTLIDMSVNNPLYYIMYIGTQYTLCGLRRRIVWKCIQRQDQTATISIRNIWALKVLLCTYPTCIYINVRDGCIRRIII